MFNCLLVRTAQSAHDASHVVIIAPAVNQSSKSSGPCLEEEAAGYTVVVEGFHTDLLLVFPIELQCGLPLHVSPPSVHLRLSHQGLDCFSPLSFGLLLHRAREEAVFF